MPAKHDSAGKPPFQLVPARALLDVSKAFGFGARKYGADDWRKGMPLSELYGSAGRHLLKWSCGQDYDEESGLSPLAHAAADILMMLELARGRRDLDDRHGATVCPLPESLRATLRATKSTTDGIREEVRNRVDMRD